MKKILEKEVEISPKYIAIGVISFIIVLIVILYTTFSFNEPKSTYHRVKKDVKKTTKVIKRPNIVVQKKKPIEIKIKYENRALQLTTFNLKQKTTNEYLLKNITYSELVPEYNLILLQSDSKSFIIYKDSVTLVSIGERTKKVCYAKKPKLIYEIVHGGAFVSDKLYSFRPEKGMEHDGKWTQLLKGANGQKIATAFHKLCKD